MTPARYIAGSLVGAVLLLGAAGLVNFVVDPFQQYREPTRYHARFFRSFQRHENPGIARNYAYDRAVVGSSFFENISGSEVDAAFGGGHTMNLCMSAMTAYDERKLLEVILRKGAVKQVITNVDYNMFSGPVDRSGFANEKLPLYLYDETHWNDYPYLLSMLTLRKSLDILGRRPAVGQRIDRDKPWYWGDEETFGAKNVIARLDYDDLNKRFKQPPRGIDGMMRSFEANFVPVVAAHPETTFYFVWPPHSILVWVDFRERRQLEVSLEFKKRFFEAMSRFPNARIYDFQDRTDLIYNLEDYRDIYHFSPKVSSMIVREIAQDKDRLTAANVDGHIAHLRAIALAADKRKIFDEARR